MCHGILPENGSPRSLGYTVQGAHTSSRTLPQELDVPQKYWGHLCTLLPRESGHSLLGPHVGGWGSTWPWLLGGGPQTPIVSKS